MNFLRGTAVALVVATGATGALAGNWGKALPADGARMLPQEAAGQVLHQCSRPSLGKSPVWTPLEAIKQYIEQHKHV